jgi:uncharacterized repeat protein (TIGR03803 family)
MRSRLQSLSFMLSILILLAAAAAAQTETILHSFAGGHDGGYPASRLILDPQGNLYGLAVGDTRTAAGYGTVFKVAPGGRETVLYALIQYSFLGGISGVAESVNLISDAQGNLYGATAYGGAEGACCGEIFEVSPTGGEKLVYAFPNINPSAPADPFARDAEGNIYGSAGDNSYGTIIKLTPTGTVTELHSFSNTDGWGGAGGLIIDSAGNLYGTSGIGGSYQCSFGCGTLYELKAASEFELLHSFSGPDGYYPNADLITDADGNLYGTTRFGGSNAACTYNGGCGTVFEITASGTETVLYNFSGGMDGLYPYAGLVRDKAGNLYGTTFSGGISSCFFDLGCGVVFKLAPDGTETVVYSFTGAADGGNPNGALALDSKGNLYGTTLYDGAHGYGTVFKVTP